MTKAMPVENEYCKAVTVWAVKWAEEIIEKKARQNLMSRSAYINRLIVRDADKAMKARKTIKGGECQCSLFSLAD